MEEKKTNNLSTTAETELPEYDGYDENGGYWICSNSDDYDASYDTDIIAEEILYRRSADRMLIDAINLLANQYLGSVSNLLGLEQKETEYIRDALTKIVNEKKKTLYSEKEE